MVVTVIPREPKWLHRFGNCRHRTTFAASSRAYVAGTRSRPAGNDPSAGVAVARSTRASVTATVNAVTRAPHSLAASSIDRQNKWVRPRRRTLSNNVARIRHGSGAPPHRTTVSPHTSAPNGSRHGSCHPRVIETESAGQSHRDRQPLQSG